jgi:hypothetical protein
MLMQFEAGCLYLFLLFVVVWSQVTYRLTSWSFHFPAFSLLTKTHALPSMSQLSEAMQRGGQPILTEAEAKQKIKEIGKQSKNNFVSLLDINLDEYDNDIATDVRKRLLKKDTINRNGIEKKVREDLTFRSETLCRLGEKPRFWTYPDAILETRSESFRHELKEKFPGLFPFKAHSRNKRNSEGEMIYRSYYGELERLLVRILKYEAERMRRIPKLRTAKGGLGFVARNMTAATPSPSKPSPSKRSTIVVRKLGKSHLSVRSITDRSEFDKFSFTKLYDESALKELDLNGSKGKLSPRRSCETSQKRSLTT